MLKSLALIVLCSVALQYSVNAAADAPRYAQPKKLPPAFLTQEEPVNLLSLDTDDFFGDFRSKEFAPDSLVVVHLYLSHKETYNLWLTEADFVPFIGHVKAIIITNNAEPFPQIYYKSNVSGQRDCKLCRMRIPKPLLEDEDLPNQHICILFWPAGAAGIEQLLTRCGASLQVLNLAAYHAEEELSEIELEPVTEPSSSMSASSSTPSRLSQILKSTPVATLKTYGSYYGNYLLTGAWSAAAAVQSRFSVRSSSESSDSIEMVDGALEKGHRDDPQEQELIDGIFADDSDQEITPELDPHTAKGQTDQDPKIVIGSEDPAT